MRSSSTFYRRGRPILAGATASLLAPTGWYVLRVVGFDAEPLAELVQGWPLYLYLFAGAAGLVVFSVVWWIRADKRLTEARQRIERVSRSDAATGVLNTAGLQEAVAQWAALATRKSLPLALVRISIAPSIGGLPAGDRVLVYRAVTAALRAGRRKEDLIARLSRGEFAVLMPCADAEGARAAIERMLGLVREKTVTTASGKHVTIDAVAGYSTLQRKENAALLARRAERALATAKRTGSKQAVFADGDLPPPAPKKSNFQRSLSEPVPAAEVSLFDIGGAGDTTLRAFTAGDDTDADTDAAVESALSAVLDTGGADADEELV